MHLAIAKAARCFSPHSNFTFLEVRCVRLDGKKGLGTHYNQGISVLGDIYHQALKDYTQSYRSMGYTRLYNLLGDPALLIAGVDAGYELKDEEGFDVWRLGRYTIDEQLNQTGSPAGYDGDGDGAVVG